MLLKNC